MLPVSGFFLLRYRGPAKPQTAFTAAHRGVQSKPLSLQPYTLLAKQTVRCFPFISH